MKSETGIKQFFTFALMLTLSGIAASPALAEEENAEKKKEEEQEKREAERAEEKRKELEAELKPLFSFTFDDVAGNLVIIECTSSIGRSSGSGFIAREDGKTYIYTNQHVIMGADSIVLKTVTGEEIKPLGVELSVTRDIARILIEDREDPFVISRNLAIDMPLAVFGNSEGSGVATELYGKVTSVGSDLLEVSAEFVSGNSGSPVFNVDREVIGIASFVRFSVPSEEEENEEKARFKNETRRFCYRLTDVKFAPVNWRWYNENFGKPYIMTRNSVESIAAIIDNWYDAPLESVPTENYPDISLTSWSTVHNRMVDRVSEIIEKRRFSRTQQTKLRDEVYKSAHDLANISHRLAVDVEKQSEEKALTGFLRSELEGYAYGLEFASRVLDYVGEEVAKYIDNL